MVDDSVSRGIPITELDRYIGTLSDCKPLTESDIRLVCEKAREIFYNESNVQPVRCPVTVVGDMYVVIHSNDSIPILATGSSMTFWKCSELAGPHQILIICSWVIMLTGDISVWKS